jgi:glycosyltransferase involved in cell wall biosynthesis
MTTKLSHLDRPLAALMISPQFRPVVGGYERAAERLCGALAAAGLRVVVITERRQQAWPAVESVAGFEIRRLPCWYRRRVHALTSLASFASFLLRHGREFDVWHVHQYCRHAALAVAMGKLLDRPVVLKLTSTGVAGVAGRPRRGGSPLLASLHRHVSACVAVSDETRALAIGLGIAADRIHDIPNGVDGVQFAPALAAAREAARRQLGLGGERVVLYVGRMSPEKNLSGLLDAWQLVARDDRGRARLVLVGDGPDHARIRRNAADPRLAGTVHLAGQRDDVETWYRAADVFVLASHFEGLSNAMVEAMASGLPVVSTRVSGSAILVEPPASGLVVDPGDPAALAGALRDLLARDDVRDELGRNARRKFEARFSLDSVSRQTIELYRALAEPTHREAA